MKNREEFIQSVWEKSEKALAEERLRRVRRRRAGGFAAAAACVMLVIGVGTFDNLADTAGEAMEGTAYNVAVQLADGYADSYSPEDQATASVALPGDAAGAAGSDGAETDDADGAAAATIEDGMMVADGALNMGGLSETELYGELQRQTEEASKSKGSDFMGYYCLPIGVRIEDENGSLVFDTDAAENDGNEEKLILQYMQWFYTIPENQVVTALKFNDIEEKPENSYKFTMDFSLGADTEGVDVIYYIIGDVDLP